MTAVLLDTNAYTAFKQGLPDAVDIVQRTPSLMLSSVVIGELLAGFALGSRDQQNRRELQQFLASPRVSIVGADERTAVYYAAVYKGLRSRGRPIPTNDLGSQRRRYSIAVRSSAMTDTFKRSMD